MLFYCLLYTLVIIVGLALDNNPNIAEMNNNKVGMFPINRANINSKMLPPIASVAYKQQINGAKYNNVAINIKIPPTLAFVK